MKLHIAFVFSSAFVFWTVSMMLPGHCYALNDPMRPPFFDGSGSANAPEINRPLVLSMVLIANERRVAVINGKSVLVGDEVDGHRLLRIDRNKVIVSRKGKVKEIYMGTKPQEQNTTVSNQKVSAED
ncbi:MAG: hypothetical protein R3208_15050 [Ketobacteraceae bacterium]|nr:hypothetical protein [Ketobacteraceae bacterium]